MKDIILRLFKDYKFYRSRILKDIRSHPIGPKVFYRNELNTIFTIFTALMYYKLH